jgi:hypothetical protein
MTESECRIQGGLPCWPLGLPLLFLPVPEAWVQGCTAAPAFFQVGIVSAVAEQLLGACCFTVSQPPMPHVPEGLLPPPPKAGGSPAESGWEVRLWPLQTRHQAVISFPGGASQHHSCVPDPPVKAFSQGDPSHFSMGQYRVSTPRAPGSFPSP